MSSTLGCIGLAVEEIDRLDSLVERLVPDATVVARSGDLQARRWTDRSGASLTMTVRETGDDGGVLVDIVPSYVATASDDDDDGILVGSLTGYGETLAADLVDATGETVARIACDLAQSIVAEISEPLAAHLTALGLEITVHADATAYAASDASILGTPGPGTTPQRFATESLLAYGLFETADKAQPTAFLSGTVLTAQTHVNTETEQPFHTARLRTVGGIVTVCLAGAGHRDPPEPGNVISGICYLVLDVPGLW